MFSRLMNIIKPGDRRRERRVKTRFPAEVGGISGRVTDLSLGGFGFYPDERGLSKGMDVDAILHPDEFSELTIPCQIVGSDPEGMVVCVAYRDVEEEQFDPLQDIIVDQTVR